MESEDDVQVGAGQPNPMVAAIQALKTAVEELRRSTAESQREIVRLRQEMPSAADTQSQSGAMEPATETQAQSVAIQPAVNASGQSVAMQPAIGESRQVLVTDHTVAPIGDLHKKLYDLPNFTGSAEEWPLFIANFRDTTEIYNYSHRQNLIRLQKCLGGPAREAVTSLLIYPNDVPNVISELEFRFGRPDLLVKGQLAKIQHFPAIAENKLDQVIQFSSKVRNVVAFLKSANCQQHLANTTLLEQMVSKLTQQQQFDWARYATTISPYPTVEHFSTWLNELARIVCLMPAANTQTTRGHTSISHPRRLMHIDRAKDPLKCYHCNGNHSICQCEAFKSIGMQARWELVKSQQLCFSCLRKGHGTQKCRSKKRCNIDGCQRYHNQLLHNEPIVSQLSGQRSVTTTPTNGLANQPNNTTQPLLNCRLTDRTYKQLFKILPVNIYGPNGRREVLAMFDEGSSISIIEERIAKMIGVKGHPHPLTLQWYDNKVVTEQAYKTDIEVGNCINNERFVLKDVYTLKNLNLPEQSLNKEDYSHLRNLPLMNYCDGKPCLLIGLKHAYLSATNTIVKADNESPLAAKTSLGWVAYGPSKSPSSLNPRVMLVQKTDHLHEMVAQYFSADSFGTNDVSIKLESEDDKRARRILEETTKRVGKQFETGLLWREHLPKLPDSKAMAEKRLLSVERQMKNDNDFRERYQHEMEKYVKYGYARKLSNSEINAPHLHIWYLPHFAVRNPNKPEKLRIVFDAAAAINNVSLNTSLLKGPEQAQPLIRVLLQFRQGVIGVAADIREMFLRVKIRKEDQHVQRYLWRDGDSSKPIEEYVMTSLIFGAICSPCIAEYVKNKNAEDFRNRFPDAVATIINKHYVDDMVASFDTPQQAIIISRNIVNINREAGFELRNFISNCAAVEVEMNNLSTSGHKPISMERNAVAEKVLGLYWNTEEDTFEFHTKFHRVPREVLDSTRAPTKRELLQIVMSVFDPFGMLAHFLLFTKLLIQDTWKRELGWDEVLPEDLSGKWLLWWREFFNVKRFKLPRCHSPYLSKGGTIELHICVDASQVAFAAVGYIRVIHEGIFAVSFVIGKTRTAPVKLMSIPRLELQAAVLGTRLAKLICDQHEFKVERTIFWTDSQTVLQWVWSSERKYKPFVGHRIAEILTSSCKEQWRWVPTAKNPADVATRPPNPPKFDDDSPWIKGPDFLYYDEQHWPTMTIYPSPELPEEAKSGSVLFVHSSSAFIDFARFSTYSKLQRTVAWVIRATSILLKKERMPGSLTVSEIERAESIIYKLVQRESFAREIESLLSPQNVSKQSPLYKLSPCIDHDGILRLSGRIDEATYLPLQARRPVLLPQKHIVSTLIAKHFHEKHHHQNFSIAINAVRQKYWIPQLKSLLRCVQAKCMSCAIDRAKPNPPMMGQLPIDRVTPFVRPFTYTGVDLFGPFNVSIGRRREKRWGVIFTCLTVRAAHIELAENLSTDAFILCLRNFVNRRGTPVRIRSDNGTNFIGAQKELRSAELLLDTDRIQSEATKFNIDWVFNCPANPSSGGCWERLIRVIKSFLNKTLRDTAPKVDTLQSVLIEAENIINSRPLTDVPVNHEDDEPLTPNHFLLGCVNSTQTPHPVDEKICLRKQWRIAQNLKDRLWKRWTTDYLPQLLCRSKWQESVPPLQVHDLVIICDPSLPRRQWQRGRVTQVFPGKDGQVRVAEVKTSGGLLRRPASRLARLTVDGESQGDSRGVGC